MLRKLQRSGHGFVRNELGFVKSRE